MEVMEDQMEVMEEKHLEKMMARQVGEIIERDKEWEFYLSTIMEVLCSHLPPPTSHLPPPTTSHLPPRSWPTPRALCLEL